VPAPIACRDLFSPDVALGQVLSQLPKRVPTLRCQCVVRETARARSALMPGTMVLASANSSSRCGWWSMTAATATAGIPMPTALLASVEPRSAGRISGEPLLRKKFATASAVWTTGWFSRSLCGRPRSSRQTWILPCGSRHPPCRRPVSPQRPHHETSRNLSRSEAKPVAGILVKNIDMTCCQPTCR
jgi:hypothetical protein